jgi:putative ABC transport system permease protein
MIVTVWKLIRREMAHSPMNFALAVLSVAVAAGSLLAAMGVLEADSLRTQQILQQREAQTRQRMADLEDAMRRATLKMGYNLAILPKDQKLSEYHAQQFSSFMPQEFASRLEKARLATVQHLLPCLQQRIDWPEAGRTMILVGTDGELTSTAGKKPLAKPVPEGGITLGSDLARQAGVKPGGELKLLGRAFRVHEVHTPRGDSDDVTAWVGLSAAQQILDKPGQINAILAVECECAWAEPEKVRQELSAVLGDVQVVERQPLAAARAEARKGVGLEAQAAVQRELDGRNALRAQREQLAAILVPLVMVMAGLWVAMLAGGNVRQRRGEIGILQALGARPGQVLALFMGKAAVVGIAGGLIGLAIGLVGSATIASWMERMPWQLHVNALHAAGALTAAPVLAMLASWLPAILAWRQDPAVILQES